MSSSADYWRRREEAQRAHNITDEREYAREISKIYESMLASIEEQINSFYAKYASDEGITMAEAKKRAASLDIERYARKAERYVSERDFSAKANEEMRLYNLTMKVNRLELLKANIGLELVSGHDELERFMEEKIGDATEDELRRQAGILGKTVINNAKTAHVIVNASFHNATFSDRIWMHQDLLRNDINSLIQVGLIQGKNPRVLARELRRKFKVKKSDAERLMRTEMARARTDAQMREYEENGFGEYKYIACGGSDVCDVCKKMDEKVFSVKKIMPGVNAPPMHPNCHCSTAPYIDEKKYYEWLDSYDQHHMSYNDWVEMHGDSKSGDSLETDFKKFKRGQKFPKEIDGAPDRKQYIKTRKEYQKATREKFLHGTELGKRIFVQYADQSVIETLMETKVVRYQDGKMYLNMYNDLHDPRGAATGYFHEFGHQIDEKLGWKFTKDSSLRDKLKNDFYNISNEEIYEEIKTNYKASSVSDMIGGLSDGEIRGRYGHKQDYWETKSHITSEFFAHFIEAQFDSERRKILESTFPESYNYVEEMLERGKPK